MAVLRVHKTKDYTVMSNYHFREKGMTLKAKGLLSLMLSLPDTWDYSIAGLVAICVEKESAIKSTLKELNSFGYLFIEKKMPNETESGRIEYVYHIYEQPFEKQVKEKQGVENQPLEIQSVENQVQYSTYKSSTKKSTTNISSKENNNITTVPSNRLQEVETFFESVWALYPKKTNKSQIKKATKERLYKIGYEKLSRCIERYKQELEYNGTDYQFIKAGSTFFNGGYEDYLADDWKLPERRFTPVSKQSGSSGNVFLDIWNEESGGHLTNGKM